jgi:hypothetical protein
MLARAWFTAALIGFAVCAVGLAEADNPPPATRPVIGTPHAINPAPAASIAHNAIPLFNGKDLSGWTWHSTVAGSTAGETWSVKEGILHSGTGPTGYIATEKDYQNFTLTVEYRHLTALNGGIYICIHGEAKVWPDALQIQGKFGAVGDLINQNTGMKAMKTDPVRTRIVNRDVVVSRLVADAEKPLKEWNTLTIRMNAGKLDVTLNGNQVNTADDLAPSGGKIGLQAEGAEMEFRKIELETIQ